MRHQTKVVIALALTGLLAGCVAGTGGDSYSREQTRREQTVRMGVVESVREVQIDGTRSAVGAIAGGAIGGIAGSTVGGGRGSDIAAVLGAVAGGVAGQAVEQSATRKTGLEITVKLDSGQLIAITQQADEKFAAGDRVRILSDGQTSRVTR